MTVDHTTLTGVAAAPLIPALVNLYATVYAEPPYEEGPEQVAVFAEKLPEETTRPGFSVVAAHRDRDLVGGAYGWTMPAGEWWSRADAGPDPEVLAVAKFAVMEWIVHPGHRQQGIGAQMMRRLLASRPEAWATLASDPRSLARRLYERAGWRKVGASRLPWGPAMDLLVLPLPAIRGRRPGTD
ncbi:GNAT family N-acetyltransferase [Plantactinospora soyae]|uniref:GNAT superfamily N-acetyltransferase n=1 Tax=Plantactinospora soyae TaxID=1544732 RepID=A0A927QXU8_9ACTN|nr:GNAT family N-acetyltransferase [Plantactinospora soyae]MBE1485863.1 GNAT superfamily N-acetyltransferase [Plantactinospora soyae]